MLKRTVAFPNFIRSILDFSAKKNAPDGKAVGRFKFHFLQHMLRFRRFCLVIFALGRELVDDLCEVFSEFMQRLERESKTRLLLLLFLRLRNALLELFEVDDDPVLFRKFLDPDRDIQRHPEVHKEYAEENADDKGEFNMMNKPYDGADDGRVDDIVEKYSNEQPKERKQGTYDALNVPPAVRIVPQLDLHPLDEDEPGDVLDEGHRDAHDEDDEEIVKPLHARVDGDEGDGEEPREAESVEWKAGPRQKSGVEPPLGGKETAEENFKTPAENAPDKKEKTRDEKAVDK